MDITIDNPGNRFSDLEMVMIVEFYDAANRPLAVVDPLANRTTLGYDSASRRNSVMNPLGQIATTVFDADSQPVTSIDPRGYRTTNVYDATGPAHSHG